MAIVRSSDGGGGGGGGQTTAAGIAAAVAAVQLHRGDQRSAHKRTAAPCVISHYNYCIATAEIGCG